MTKKPLTWGESLNVYGAFLAYVVTGVIMFIVLPTAAPAAYFIHAAIGMLVLLWCATINDRMYRRRFHKDDGR